MSEAWNPKSPSKLQQVCIDRNHHTFVGLGLRQVCLVCATRPTDLIYREMGVR